MAVLETPSLPQGDWGQAAANNTVGWGQGACTSRPWGSIHGISYGHAITNLKPCGDVPEEGFTVWFPVNNLTDDSTSDLYSANQVNFVGASNQYARMAVQHDTGENSWSYEFIIEDFDDPTNRFLGTSAGNNSVLIANAGNIIVRTQAAVTHSLACDFTVPANNTANVYKIVADAEADHYYLYINGLLFSDIAGDGTSTQMVWNALSRRATLPSSDNNYRYARWITNGVTIGEWRFTEGIGEKIYDSSGAGNHMTLFGDTIPLWETGKDTTLFTPNKGDATVYARDFDGVADEINFAGVGTSLAGQTVAITFVADDITTNQEVYQYSVSTTERFGVGVNAGSVGIALNSGVVITITETFSNLGIGVGDVVELVAVITDYTSAVVTINGVIATGSDALVGPDSSGHILGNRAGADRPFLGKVTRLTNAGTLLEESNGWTGGPFSPVYTGTKIVQSNDYDTAVSLEYPPTWVDSNGPNAELQARQFDGATSSIDYATAGAGTANNVMIVNCIPADILNVGFIYSNVFSSSNGVTFLQVADGIRIAQKGNGIDVESYVDVDFVGLGGAGTPLTIIYTGDIATSTVNGNTGTPIIADAGGISADRRIGEKAGGGFNFYNGIVVDVTDNAEVLSEATNWGGGVITGTTVVYSFDGGLTFSATKAPTFSNVIAQTAVIGYNNYDFFDRATPIGFEKNGSTLPINGATFVIDFVTLQTTDTQIIYDISNTTDVLALRVMIVAGDLIIQLKDAFEIVNFWNLVATIAANVEYTLTIVVSGGLITSADLSGTPLIDQGVGASQSYPGVDSIAYGQEVAFGGSNHFNGVIFNVNTGGVDYNYFDSWDGATPFLGAIPQKMVVPVYTAGLDALGFTILRAGLTDGYSWSGQLLHHLDTLTMVSRETTGIVGVEVNSGSVGASSMVPSTQFLIPTQAAGTMEFTVYSAGSPFVMGQTASTSSHIQLTATTVLWRFGGQTVTVMNTDVDPRGKIVRLERDAGATPDARLFVDGVLKDTIVGAPSNQFAPQQLGASNGVGVEARFTYFKWNETNGYLFNSRGDDGNVVNDLIGANPLTLTSLGNGLPEYVISTNAGVVWALDDGTADLGGSTDAYWVSQKGFELIQRIAGDDVFNNLNNTGATLDAEFNGIGISSDAGAMVRNAPIWIAFVQDGNGRGSLYMAEWNGAIVLLRFGTVGILQATAANMFYGNFNPETALNAFNGYQTQMINYGRQLPPEGLFFLKELTESFIPIAQVIQRP